MAITVQIPDISLLGVQRKTFPPFDNMVLTHAEEARLNDLLQRGIREVVRHQDPESIDVVQLRNNRTRKITHTLLGPKATLLKGISNIYNRLHRVLIDPREADDVFTNLVRQALDDPQANPFELEFAPLANPNFSELDKLKNGVKLPE